MKELKRDNLMDGSELPVAGPQRGAVIVCLAGNGEIHQPFLQIAGIAPFVSLDLNQSGAAEE